MRHSCSILPIPTTFLSYCFVSFFNTQQNFKSTINGTTQIRFAVTYLKTFNYCKSIYFILTYFTNKFFEKPLSQLFKNFVKN